ncbi:MAG: arginine--tRNA ligase [Candidatus Omnitrophica bacterium]|nr:arginine--tRNA ligase [Candidatus Omnitrophota bacterium]
MKKFYQKISKALENVIKKEYGVELAPPLWELPQKQEFGDLSSTVALRLASKLKKSPIEIALQLKAPLEKLLSKDVEKVEIIKPGFLNLFISQATLVSSLNELLRNKDKFFRRKLKKKILLEFVSANPTGPLSIAHGRQAVVGDVIANALEFFGNQVEREYYINDTGRQIELLVSSLEARIREINGQALTLPQDGYKGEYIRDIAKEYLRQRTKREELRRFVLSNIMALIKKDLLSLGVKFDNWISQRKIVKEKKVQGVVDILRRRGLIYEKEGAFWFSSTKFGDDKDRVVKKSDGQLPYFVSDIAYHKDKIKRRFNSLINLWGPDHHGYIGRVEAAIDALGYKREILKVIIIQLVTIKQKIKMSKRAGTAILLSDLISEVGKDAARFYYLTRRNSSHLEFDIDLACAASFDNPLYYIQYACVRIESIFRKAKAEDFDAKYSNFLTDSEDLGLLRSLLQFPYCLEKVCYSLEPVFIIEFLKNLASSFHKFYERKRVLVGAKELMLARLNLLEATRIVLHCGLNLLGIKPVRRM